MKKFTLKAIFAFAALIMPLMANAQTYEVYKTNGEKVTYNYNDVDSIVFKAAKPAPELTEFVDLGLSVKWATCNLGAETPADFGDYFAWGETETKEIYNAETSMTYMKDIKEDIAGNPEYDAATAILGAEWRMPTYEEMEELDKQCSWEWTTEDGSNGYRITGPNGNSIFLPAAGRWIGDTVNYTNFSGLYWIGSPVDPQVAFCLLFDMDLHSSFCSDYRYNGMPIRPVRAN